MVKLGTKQTNPKHQVQLNVLQRITYSVDQAQPWLTLHEKYLVYNCLFKIVCFNKKNKQTTIFEIVYEDFHKVYVYLKQLTLTEKNTKTNILQAMLANHLKNILGLQFTLQQNFGSQISQSTRWPTVLALVSYQVSYHKPLPDTHYLRKNITLPHR